MNINRDKPASTPSVFAGLFDNRAATAAANRLYNTHDGIRFCSATGERLSAAEARNLDAREAARRGLTLRDDNFDDGLGEPEVFARHLADSADQTEFDDEELEIEAASDEDHLIDLDDEDIALTDDDDLIAIEKDSKLCELFDETA